jgi:hypothetical protein
MKHTFSSLKPPFREFDISITVCLIEEERINLALIGKTDHPLFALFLSCDTMKCHLWYRYISMGIPIVSKEKKKTNFILML